MGLPSDALDLGFPATTARALLRTLGWFPPWGSTPAKQVVL